MPWGMSPELAKKTQEEIRKQDSVRFPEKKENLDNKDFTVRFPEKGNSSEASLEKNQSENTQDAENKPKSPEAVNSIAPEKNENQSSDLVEEQDKLDTEASDRDREQLIEQKKEELLRERERVTSAVESVKNQERAMMMNLDALLENVAQINRLVAELNQANLQDWSEIASSVDRRLNEIDGDRLLEQLESSIASIKDLTEKKQSVEQVIDQLKRSESSEDNEEVRIEIQNLTEEYNQLSMQISKASESLSETSYAIQAMSRMMENITLDNSNRINERRGTRNRIEDIGSKFKKIERKL